MKGRAKTTTTVRIVYERSARLQLIDLHTQTRLLDAFTSAIATALQEAGPGAHELEVVLEVTSS